MPEQSTRWRAAAGAVEADLRAWHADRPDATLAEIEAALDARLREARAVLLADLARGAPGGARRCPACGGRLVRRGERTRTLRTHGEAPLALARAYLTCSACGAGLFPPR